MHLVMIKGTPAEKELQELKEFAEKPENIIDLAGGKTKDEISKFIEGHLYTKVLVLRDFVGQVGTYRICFSVEIQQAIQQDPNNPTQVMDPLDVRLRHVSIQREDHFPDPFAVFTICKFLGFTGSFEEWSFSPSQSVPNTMSVLQSIGLNQPHELVLMNHDDEVRQ